MFINWRHFVQQPNLKMRSCEQATHSRFKRSTSIYGGGGGGVSKPEKCVGRLISKYEYCLYALFKQDN